MKRFLIMSRVGAEFNRIIEANDISEAAEEATWHDKDSCIGIIELPSEDEE